MKGNKNTEDLKYKIKTGYHKEVVAHYLNAKELPYALLLNGPWGCGKTHYIQEVIQKEHKDLKFIYVSVNGMSSLDRLSQHILYTKYLSSKGKLSKGVKLSIDLLKEIGMGYLKEKTNVDIEESLKKNSNELLVFKENEVLVIDDLERLGSGIEVEELLGYVATNFTENKAAKVILIANEKEIKSEKYWTIKEKTIWQTITFKSDIGQFINQLIPTYFDNQKEIIPLVIDHVIALDVTNYRTLIHFFKSSCEIVKLLDKNIETEDLNTILYSTLIMCLEFKKESLKQGIEDKIPEWIKTEIPTISTRGPKDEILNPDSTPKTKEDILTEAFSSTYLMKRHYKYAFWPSIYYFVGYGFLDKDNVKNDYEKFLSNKRKPVPQHIQRLDSYAKFVNLEDNEIEPIVLEILHDIDESRHDLYSLARCLRVFYSHENKYSISLPSIIDIDTVLLKIKGSLINSKKITTYDEYGLRFSSDINKQHLNYWSIWLEIEKLQEELKDQNLIAFKDKYLISVLENGEINGDDFAQTICHLQKNDIDQICSFYIKSAENKNRLYSLFLDARSQFSFIYKDEPSIISKLNSLLVALLDVSKGRIGSYWTVKEIIEVLKKEGLVLDIEE